MARTRHTWVDNTRIDLKEIYVSTENWLGSAQDMNYWRVLVNGHSNSEFHKSWDYC